MKKIRFASYAVLCASASYAGTTDKHTVSPYLITFNFTPQQFIPVLITVEQVEVADPAERDALQVIDNLSDLRMKRMMLQSEQDRKRLMTDRNGH